MKQALHGSIWTRQGIWKDGRRFLKGGDVPYLFEKDKREVDRLNQQHHLLKMATGKRTYFAPITNPHMILDVASGTGIWGREVAKHFKQATVWNVDKDEAIHAQAKRVIPIPDNYLFREGWEYPAPLPFKDAMFDYVHARLIGLFVPAARWPAMIQDMLRVTRPGGWIGLMEGGLFETRSQTANLLQEAAKAMLSRYGLEPNAGPRLVEWAREAGLTSLKRKVIPVGTTLKQRDVLIQNMCTAVADAAENLIKEGLFSRDEMEDIKFALPLELRALGVQINFYAVWGQKPV